MHLEPRSYAPSDVIDVALADVPCRPVHGRTLLVHPRFFDVRYRINPHMGGRVDRARATEQWESLRAVCGHHGDVSVLDPDAPRSPLGGTTAGTGIDADTDGEPLSSVPSPAALPDMVFCANHGIATPDGEGVVLASMATPERAGEPAYFAAWCHERGYEVRRLPEGLAFEGTGDAIWHPEKRLLWGGYGIRTDGEAYDALAASFDVPVLRLELTDPRYYHLDVCFAPLDPETVLIQPEAFTEAGRSRIASVFERVLRAPATESVDGLACNCLSIDGETVVLGDGNPRTAELIENAGFGTHEVATGEFLKAGGSVRCLTLTLGDPSGSGRTAPSR
jgi:N-dimethylarginine dimethylaminohydrolase